MPEYMTVFKNVSDNPRAPVMNALFTVNGVEYECGLWVKTLKESDEEYRDSNGNRAFSGTIKPKKKREQKSAASAPQPITEDEIPF